MSNKGPSAFLQSKKRKSAQISPLKVLSHSKSKEFVRNPFLNHLVPLLLVGFSKFHNFSKVLKTCMLRIKFFKMLKMVAFALKFEDLTSQSSCIISNR
ncbi:unnamed protein product [Moneuplotes crassus]|uniref:Uncharacterized protein n=1 Tax=Euplotes crassus TaxID=5936 RepID=A0AAD1U4L1_EUPCR|nr:unnamed protein product [Moneuplotes crassus]